VHGYTRLKHARTLPAFSAYCVSDSVLCNFFSWRCLVSVSLWMRGGVQWGPIYTEQYRVTLETYVLISSISCGPKKMDKLLTQHGFPCKSSGHFSRQTRFFVLGHRLVRPLAWSCGDRIILSGLRQKWGTRKKKSCQYKWLKIANSGVHPRGPSRKCCIVFRQSFHHDCKNVLNGLAVGYKVPYLDSNVSD